MNCMFNKTRGQVTLVGHSFNLLRPRPFFNLILRKEQKRLSLTSCTLGFRLTSGEFSTEDSLCGNKNSISACSSSAHATKHNIRTVSPTSREALSVCVGVLGRGSELGSSVRGRGGVATKTGVAGVSDWSALVGVAQGEP